MTHLRLAPSEAEIQRCIVDYLRWRRWLAIRVNSGAMTIAASETHNRRFVRFVSTGGPAESVVDLLAFGPDGRTLAIEVKRPGEKPTPGQRRFLAHLAELGHPAIVATCIEDVMRALAGAI